MRVNYIFFGLFNPGALEKFAFGYISANWLDILSLSKSNVQ